MSLLGYSKGIYGDREIERYVLNDIEFAIQTVISLQDGTPHSRFYEAEIVTDGEGAKEAEEKLRSTLAELGLVVYDEERWNEYESTINKEANGWFEYGVTDTSRFL